jgi:hypothetical protein
MVEETSAAVSGLFAFLANCLLFGAIQVTSSQHEEVRSILFVVMHLCLLSATYATALSRRICFKFWDEGSRRIRFFPALLLSSNLSLECYRAVLQTPVSTKATKYLDKEFFFLSYPMHTQHGLAYYLVMPLHIRGWRTI